VFLYPLILYLLEADDCTFIVAHQPDRVCDASLQPHVALFMLSIFIAWALDNRQLVDGRFGFVQSVHTY
jgi:hypothetical protein